jgi:BirA family biotin operon repressor/biotin-[acetyl-CoA-carboxylase] ligase
VPDPIPAELARALALAGPRLGPFHQVEHHAEVDSTNAIAQVRAAGRAPHGLVVIADAQRAGRGRQGREWFSPAGAGLYMSAVARAEAWGADLALMTLGAGVAVARGLQRATGLVVELKWPNDVVIGRPWRKLSGILCESVSTGSRVDAVVIGIGVNVKRAAYPPDIADRATAIELETDRPVEPATVAVEILAGLADIFDAVRTHGGASVLEPWREYGRAGLAGARVRWNDDRVVRHGICLDIDERGALVVESAGRRERLIAGEVSWERIA